MRLAQYYFRSDSALLSGKLSTTIPHYDAADAADSALLSIGFSCRIERLSQLNAMDFSSLNNHYAISNHGVNDNGSKLIS